MKKILTLGIVLSALALPFTYLPANSVDSNITKEQGTISFSYSTEKEVSPDTVEFSVTVKTSDKKSMQEASRKNKEISNKIYEYLKSNINTQNGDYVKTSNYSATPLYIYVNNKRVFDKYEVSNNVIVHTKNLDKVAEYIDKSISLGATNVNSLNFTLSNKDNQCTELLSSAAKQIKGRANSVVSSLGSSISGIKSIRTSCSLNQRHVNYGYTNMRLMKSVGATMDAAQPEMVSTDIEAGNITIYATIDADFYVK